MEATARWLRYARGPEDLVQDLAGRITEIGHKLVEALALPAPRRWLPWLRNYREPARLIGSPLDTIDHALCRTADAARCWGIFPSTDNDRRLTRLVGQTQDAIARAYPATETTLRLLQQITPDGLKLGLIQCEDCGSPLVAISIDADHTPFWPPKMIRGPGRLSRLRAYLAMHGL